MGYEPKRINNHNQIICPLKLINPNNSNYEDVECLGLKCAWFMPYQKACAINVIARIAGYLKEEKAE